jgi:uncharacterized protein involved in high-affinity Fe2+ transport
MSKQLAKIETDFNKLLTEVFARNSEFGEFPIFDPKDFEIFKSIEKNAVTGYYLGRFEEFKEFYDLDLKMRGNGYMIASMDGFCVMIPEWKSLEAKMNTFVAGQFVKVLITAIETTKTGETYIKTSVFTK